jgi:tRNA(adenine34) deaminase
VARSEATLVSDKPGKSRYELVFSFVPEERAEWSDADRQLMKRALELARQAGAGPDAAEVPVGALIVRQDSILAEGWNASISSDDPTAHAEMRAIREASRRERNYRLPGCTLYVTLEPCAMCAGAIVLARIERLVFATRDLRFGAVRSKFRLADSELLNHRARVEEGLYAAEAAELLRQFFEKRRS